MKISWAADGGTLLGAMCYRAMPAWDDDIDLVVPQQECHQLDRIWKRGLIHQRRLNLYCLLTKGRGNTGGNNARNETNTRGDPAHSKQKTFGGA